MKRIIAFVLAVTAAVYAMAGAAFVLPDGTYSHTGDGRQKTDLKQVITHLDSDFAGTYIEDDRRVVLVKRQPETDIASRAASDPILSPLSANNIEIREVDYSLEELESVKELAIEAMMNDWKKISTVGIDLPNNTVHVDIVNLTDEIEAKFRSTVVDAPFLVLRSVPDYEEETASTSAGASINNIALKAIQACASALTGKAPASARLDTSLINSF